MADNGVTVGADNQPNNISEETMSRILGAEDGVTVYLDGVNVPEVLEYLKKRLAEEAKLKLESFNNLRQTMRKTPRVQKDLDDAYERYYQSCRDAEEVEASMSRVRRADPSRNL